MKTLILALTLVGTVSFAECPDFSGVYSHVTKKTQTTQSGGATVNTEVQSYEFMLVQQKGCESISMKSLKESGMTDYFAITIGTPDYLDFQGSKYKATWVGNQILVQAKPDAAIKRIDVSFASYGNGMVETMDYELANPIADQSGNHPLVTGHEMKIWEKIK